MSKLGKAIWLEAAYKQDISDGIYDISTSREAWLSSLTHGYIRAFGR